MKIPHLLGLKAFRFLISQFLPGFEIHWYGGRYVGNGNPILHDFLFPYSRVSVYNLNPEIHIKRERGE
jgi:hypothetical protein